MSNERRNPGPDRPDDAKSLWGPLEVSIVIAVFLACAGLLIYAFLKAIQRGPW